MTTKIKKTVATMHEAKFVRPLGGLGGLCFPIFYVCLLYGEISQCLEKKVLGVAVRDDNGCIACLLAACTLQC